MSDWQAEFTRHEGPAWAELIAGFSDANLYQTASYDLVRYRPEQVVHMVLRRDGTVAAAAQARVIEVPRARVGIAYVRWGPMWRRHGTPDDPEVFRRAVRALREELSRRRGLVLRLYPEAFRGADESLGTILEQEGFGPLAGQKVDRTLLVDLDPSLAELRAGLDQKWRNCLNRAERNGLELVSSEDDSLFDEIAAMHDQMTGRKGLVDPRDFDHLKKVQRDLPAGLKLQAVVCRREGRACAGAIFAAVGTTGVYLTGATSDVGLTTNGSYLVQWTFVQWLKEHKLLRYNLNGINPEANPGTFHFKRGLAGKRGRDVEFLGRFQVADNRLGGWLVDRGERLLAGLQRARRAARSRRAAA